MMFFYIFLFFVILWYGLGDFSVVSGALGLF